MFSPEVDRISRWQQLNSPVALTLLTSAVFRVQDHHRQKKQLNYSQQGMHRFLEGLVYTFHTKAGDRMLWDLKLSPYASSPFGSAALYLLHHMWPATDCNHRQGHCLLQLQQTPVAGNENVFFILSNFSFSSNGTRSWPIWRVISL